ncbi:hypothetical protein Syun_002994 [Stephania yunnanensis]|uniref:Uncharacterized protein n=1 Tax=Stephania yunnanensis TaxID=152371 RepID=A0AAP0L221_9MAGN
MFEFFDDFERILDSVQPCLCEFALFAESELIWLFFVSDVHDMSVALLRFLIFDDFVSKVVDFAVSCPIWIYAKRFLLKKHEDSMSGAPKRPHEEGSHTGTPKQPDGRVVKARSEPPDADRRSPVPQMNRLSLSSNDAYMEHFVSPDNRLESRNSKEERDVKIDSSRSARAEIREMYTDAKIETQSTSTRGEKDVRLDSRGNEGKEVKHDRDVNMDFKSEVRMVKDAFGSGNTHLNWKDIKEHHWTKKYPDLPSDGLDQWHVSQSSLRSTTEVGKEASAEDRNFTEAHEAVGENKVDMRGDDKLKEKERKRKDEKHREWGERDKERNERHTNTQLSYNPSERREPSKEEKEVDRRERERKDLPKDKEQPKEREGDHVRKETLNGAEKEDLRSDKDVMNGSVKMPEPESSTVEQKKPKEVDNWKAIDRDSKDRKKEREMDLEGDRPEKRSRLHEKELDDSCTEGDGGPEREREVFGSGVQQRKRMLRPRGSPQVASREPRFRSRVAENDGSQGKSEISTVVYKAGECMQELLKLWKQFEASQENRNDESSQAGPTLEIRVPAEYVTATNHQVRGGQLWGTDIYTDDSDLVAVLMHTGYCRPTSTPPPPAIQELRATIRVLPPQDSYTSTLRNNVRSRAWGAAIGCSYCVERCCIVKKGGGTIDLEPCLTHTSVLEPTLAPMAVERTMTTRSAASNALRQQRIKYSISVVADKGLKKPLYTSARLKKGEVLYLETHSNSFVTLGRRWSSAANGSQGIEAETHKPRPHNTHGQNGERNTTDRDNVAADVFRWSRCKKPLPQKVMCSIGIPLPLEHLEVLEENLDWEDVQWSQTGVWIAGKEYVLARVHFLSPK